MKKLFAMTVLLVVALTGAAAIAKFFAADFMSTVDAEKKWGVKNLEISEFKKGDLKMRSPMAVDILKRSLYVGERRAKSLVIQTATFSVIRSMHIK